jgi:hypothetical protein
LARSAISESGPVVFPRYIWSDPALEKPKDGVTADKLEEDTGQAHLEEHGGQVLDCKFQSYLYMCKTAM